MNAELQAPERVLESHLEAVFSKRVRKMGGYTIKLAPTERGVPDRLAVFPKGRMFLVELKTEKGRLSPLQVHWHGRMADRGVRVYTLYGEAQIKEWVAWVIDSLGPQRGAREPWGQS